MLLTRIGSRGTYGESTCKSITEFRTSIAPCCPHGVGEEGGGPVQEGLYQGPLGDFAELIRELNYKSDHQKPARNFVIIYYLNEYKRLN